MNKFIRIGFLVFALGLVFFAIFKTKTVKGRTNVRFDEFNSANILGVISCTPSGSVSGVKICVGDSEYYFHPYTSNLNDNKIFNYLAEEGDSVRKLPFSDTLFLKKGDKYYLYTFNKLD